MWSCDHKVRIGKHVYTSTSQRVIFNIYEDGTFLQSIEYFHNGANFQYKGKWKQLPGGIEFFSFFRSVGTEKNSYIYPPEECSPLSVGVKEDVMIFYEYIDFWTHLEK